MPGQAEETRNGSGWHQKISRVDIWVDLTRQVGFMFKINDLGELNGGEGEIRTPDRVAPMPHFECGAFNHSATSPQSRGQRLWWAVRTRGFVA